MKACINAISIATLVFVLAQSGCAEDLGARSTEELGESELAVQHGSGTWFDARFDNLAGWTQWEADRARDDVGPPLREHGPVQLARGGPLGLAAHRRSAPAMAHQVSRR